MGKGGPRLENYDNGIILSFLFCKFSSFIFTFLSSCDIISKDKSEDE